ncbi:uncharacterized protein SCHCODRAFT_02630488 [Schizophyllum commune H4-8]|nr:uncharacterized protein SCHCODRAFT_02630488 [Schizophyllum commune H4-8]KAI5889961.1 hypothetical protein SCHCODRAFT_02630488 [Schizophyllum commune H4-8]
MASTSSSSRLPSTMNSISYVTVNDRPRFTRQKSALSPQTTDVDRTSPPPYEGVYTTVCRRTKRLYQLAHRTEATVQDALLDAPRDAGSTCYSLRITLTSLLLSLARLKQAIAEHRDVLPEATDQWCDHHLPYVEAILFALEPFSFHEDFDVSLTWLRKTAEELRELVNSVTRSYRKLMYHHFREVLRASQEEAAAAREVELERRAAFMEDHLRRKAKAMQTRSVMAAYKKAARTGDPVYLDDEGRLAER